MKITGKKNIEAERLRGRSAIDAVMLPKIAAVMGDPVKFALYTVKAANSRMFADGFRNVIIEQKHEAQMMELVKVEDERQALQARIDAATTAIEIEAIIAAL